MSDTVQGALIAGVAGVAGGLIALAGNFILEKRRELTSYRVNLYAKRLEVHQQAFEWNGRLAKILHSLQSTRPANEQLKQVAQNASDWWDANSLYLDRHSRSEFLSFLFLCRARARGDTELSKDIWNQLDRVEKAVVTGIGEKHIDVDRTPDDR